MRRGHKKPNGSSARCGRLPPGSFSDWKGRCDHPKLERNILSKFVGFRWYGKSSAVARLGVFEPAALWEDMTTGQRVEQDPPFATAARPQESLINQGLRKEEQRLTPRKS